MQLGSIYLYYDTVGTISKDILEKTLNGYTQFPFCCCLCICDTIKLCSEEASPCSVFGYVGGVLGRGQAEVTQVVLLSFHHQSGDPDQMQMAGDGSAVKCWSALSTWYLRTTHDTEFTRAQIQTENWRLPHFSALLRFAETESLRWFNAVFKSAKVQIKSRGSLSEQQPVTPGSRTETISAASDEKHHPVSSSSSACSSLTLECGRFVKFLIQIFV